MVSTNYTKYIHPLLEQFPFKVLYFRVIQGFSVEPEPAYWHAAKSCKIIIARLPSPLKATTPSQGIGSGRSVCDTTPYLSVAQAPCVSLNVFNRFEELRLNTTSYYSH